MVNILSVKLDFLFKLLFGSEHNIDILANFLSAVLSIKREEFTDIQILDTSLKKEHDEDKLGILDVNLKTRGGLYINLEIQVINKRDFEKRTLYYTSKRLVGQLGEGDSYTKLNPTISINIIDFNLFEYEKYHSTFWLKEEKEGTKLTDILRIDFLELQKAKYSKDTDIKRLWMDFFNAESEAELKMLEQRDKVFERPVAEVIRLSGNDAIRAEYESRQKAIRDRMAEIALGEERGLAKGLARGLAKGLAKGREEGIIEGIAKGKAEGISEGIAKGIAKGEHKKAIEMAKQLYIMGLSIKQIMDISGLALHEIEEITGERS